MNILFLILGVGVLLPVVLARFLFLARSRAGWVMYLANVAWEFASKRFGAGRFRLELGITLLGLELLWVGGAAWSVVAATAGALLLLELANRLWERNLLTAARVNPVAPGPAPSVCPELILTVDAPFIERLPGYRLGVLWVGVPFEIELMVANPARVPTQTPVRIVLDVPSDWYCEGEGERWLEPIPAGTVSRTRWSLRPGVCKEAGSIRIRVEGGGGCQSLSMAYEGCRSVGEDTIKEAVIRRYPGARRSAFVWRGDMDLYDTVTLQSIEGLETALGLAARYCFPQTMCLSTRLSLDEAAAREWAGHYGVDRGASQIPRFVQWLRASVDLRHACPYPAQSGKRYLMELGNHGHLHYDTATSAAPENGWRSHARMGAGRYAWMGEDASSFGEQRDNILEARRWCERVLAFAPRSWAKPGRCNDMDTPRAVEAAGCEVLSGSDIRACDNVLYQPPPHHPRGTSAVELTTRYPGDPQHVYHLAMLLFWLDRSRRLGIPMVYMCHQHMRQFEGTSCVRLTEYLLRTVLADFHGEFRVDTLFGIGKYWREVLSPQTRRVTAVLSGTRLRVENRSDVDFEGIPVDLVLAGGGQSTVLVSVPRGSHVDLELAAGHRGQE